MRRDSREVLFRPSPPPDFTVSYGDHPDQVGDVRLARARRDEPAGPGIEPAGPGIEPAGLGIGPAPLLIFLHGGFWRREYDRAHAGPLAVALCGAGFTVVTAEYRRTGSPGGGWPGTFDDVAAAVAAIPRLVAERTGVDVSRVVLAGHSAGGQLALWAAARCRVDGLRGVAALAPVADLRAAYRLDLDGGAVAALLGGGPDDLPERYASADPMALTPVGALVGAPVAIVHGVLDRQVPVDFSRRFAASATAAGDDVRYLELPNMDHFDLIDPLSPAWSMVVGAVHAVARD